MSESRPGASLKNFKGRIETGQDGWTVASQHLSERAGDMPADGVRTEDIFGEDDAIHQVGSAQPAIWGDLVPPVANLDSLGLRPEQAASRRGQNYSWKSAEHLDYQPDSPRPSRGGRDGAADPLLVEAGHSIAHRKNERRHDGLSFTDATHRRSRHVELHRVMSPCIIRDGEMDTHYPGSAVSLGLALHP